MPKLKFVLKISNEQLAALIASKPGNITVEAVGTEQRTQTLYKVGPMPGAGILKPPKIKNPEQYLRKPGSKERYRLSDEGLKLIWDLHHQGYANSQISEGFKGLIGEEAVRRLIRKIKASK